MSTRRPVLVGIDGSADARRAMCLAGEYALAMNTDLVIVHSVGLTEVVNGQRVVAESHSGEISEQFAGWCEAVRSAGVDEWTPMLLDGAPVDTILRVADEIDASLVVVGRQGSGKRPELLLGSTAHQIAENCPRPVLVVPPIGRVTHRDE
jgi:nucleotide-binding universal stress UspA family protein